MNFTSDNTAGVSQIILAAIQAANEGAAPAYGEDPFSAKATELLSDVFEIEVAVFLVATGTAANALALGALCPPWGAIFCHKGSHIMEDECGAPEMFTAGAKLVGISGRAGKIAPKGLAETLSAFPRGALKQVQPSTLSISQGTECGTLYTCAEVGELSSLAHEAGVSVHMDGARFANAVVALNCTPAQVTWKAGVDVLSFGATKNGALACEAVVVFDPSKSHSLPFQRKRSGHTMSKGRFLGAQMIAYLEDGHWLDNASAANGHAIRLAQGLAQAPGVRLPWPRQINEVFAILPRKTHAALRAAGVHYYDWTSRDFGEKPLRDEEVFARLVTSFATSADDVERLINLVQRGG
jgi:threonine aldolase